MERIEQNVVFRRDHRRRNREAEALGLGRPTRSKFLSSGRCRRRMPVWGEPFVDDALDGVNGYTDRESDVVEG